MSLKGNILEIHASSQRSMEAGAPPEWAAGGGSIRKTFPKKVTLVSRVVVRLGG